MHDVYVHSSNISKFGKQTSTVLDLSLSTAKVSLGEFGYDEIDFCIFTSFCPEIFTQEFHLSSRIAEGLGLKDVFCIRTETASSSGASAFHIGTRLIQSGKYRSGLIIGTEIMSKLSREESNILLGSVLSQSQRKLGMSMAQGGALVAQRYLEEFGYARKDLYAIAKKLHDNGLKNPIAHIKKDLSWETYESSPMISSPFCLYDISPLSDGSVSMVLSSKKSNIKVRGIGSGIAPMDSSIQNLSFPASTQAFHNAYKESGLSPSDIQVAELHDAFTLFEVIGMEDSGLVPKGKALASIVNGETHPDNRLPINPSGGLKSRGHPVGASGLAQIAELARFWEKRPELRIGLAHSIGGLATNNFATILEYKG